MTNAKTKYVRAVKRHLACSFTAKQRITKHLTAALSELDTAATYPDIILAYGEPQAVAEEYLSVMSDKELKHLTFWKAFAIGLCAITVAVCLFFLCIAIYIWIDGIVHPPIIVITSQEGVLL